MYYEIITQSLLTRCQQSVSFFFFLFFWLTHAISHRNIVYALNSHALSLSPIVYRFSHSLFSSYSLILTFGRSLPGSLLHFVPNRARENSKDAISASLKRHGGDNVFPVPPLSSPFFFLSLFLYITAPLS